MKGSIATIVCAACVGPLAGQAPHATGAPQVPLREGLTIVEAYRNTRGDYEAIMTIARVDATSITVAASSDEATDTCRAAQPGRRGSMGLRTVLREDLENGHELRHEFAACASEPEIHRGSTAIVVSASVLRELNAKGQTNLRADTTVAGMVSGVLTRIERGTVPIRVIVNDAPVELAAVHTRWQSNVGAREYWILDDTANPLLLRGTYHGNPILEVVKLSYPMDGAGTATRIERALAREGRAAVYGIYFDFGSDRIKDESDRVLAEIARVLQQNPSWSLAVEGHTDNIGGDASNIDLSKRRAAAVKQALVARYRIDGQRLQTNGYGASRPKDTHDTIEGRARNRRVELVKTE